MSSNNKALVSIVLPCYNSKGVIQKVIDNILTTKYPSYELIISDDYSTDGTYEYMVSASKKNPRIRVVRNERNSGPSKTRNHGIAAAKGKYIAFLETDMEVDPNWLDILVREIELDKKLGAVQSKTLDINKRNKIHSLGVLFNPHTFWVISPGCGEDRDWQPETLEMGIGSVGSLIRKDVVDKIGGYDEKIVHNIDDLDLGWRIWLAGYRIRSIPQAITYHWTAKPSSVRTKTTSTLASEFHFHKGPRILLKNYELVNILRYLPWLFFAYGIRIFKNSLNGNHVPLRAFGKALAWYVATFNDTMNQRKRIQALRKRSDREMFDKLGIKGSFFHFYFHYTIPNLRKVKQVFE